MKRFLTFLMTVMALFAFATSVRAQGVYTPTVTDDETSVFLETSNAQAYVWAWNGGVNFSTRKFPGDKMTYMGKTSDGKNIFKWKYTGSEKSLPSNVIFSKEDNDHSKFVDDNLEYKNHGYYVEGVYDKTISSTPATPSAKTIYMFTAQNVNGVKGNYNTDAPIEEHKLSLVDGKTTLYKYEVNTSDENFCFRFYIKDDNKQLQPQANDDPVTVTAGASTLEYTNICEGSSNAWKTTFDKSAYDKLTIYLDIATHRRLWIVGSKNSVVTEKKTAPAGFYLVGNFMSPANVGGDINPGGDNVDAINYKRLYFRFTQQSDKKYSFDIPACLTANMQILKVADDGTKTAYGPGKVYQINGTWPKTDLYVPEAGSTASLVPSATLDKDNNYWSLKTRNDGTCDDDGMYTVSFEVDKNGTPTNWSIFHNSKKMVAYLLSTSYGASALPIYDKRNRIDALYTQNLKGDIHFDGKNSYYVLGYSVYTMDDKGIYDLANKAYKESGTEDDIHVNKKIGQNYGTQNKLFFFGNGGYEFSTSNNRNKLIVNQKPFTLDISGTKTVEYNPNQGDNDLSKSANACGMSAELKIPNEGTVDYPDVISLVGSAIPGTTNPADGSWNWASTAANMTFDATENCYYATIETTADCHKGYFRFVGDHSQAKNWYEDDIKTEAHMAKCEHQNQAGHTCLVDDPNTVSYTFNGKTEKTELENGIIWNREPGLYTVKLYIVTNPETKKTEFKYTITGEKNVKYPFTLLHDKFVRTYSSHQAMDIVSPDVKAYVAYKYEKPGVDEISKAHSCGKLYLRQLNYIPADMGVVLIGATPGDGTFADGDKLSYSLRLRTDASETNPAEFVNIWTKASKYTGQEWNNYLVPIVEADDNLRNAEKVDGVVTYRNFGLSTFFRTKYHKENPNAGIPNYLGFFRLMDNTKSGGNKAYLRLPANNTVGDGVGAKFGYCDYNGQFIGGTTDDDSSAFAKMMILFDDELGGVTEINKVEVTNKCHDNAYYTLQGIKVLKPTKGIYIHNGKKIVIK